MGAEPVQDWQALAASALEWWRDAGVDVLVGDEVRDWLARPMPQVEAQAAPAAVAAPEPETLPDTLEGFIAWRLGDAAPEAAWLTPRVAPSGAAGAEWVVLTDMPEAEDGDALMGGTAGRMLDRMLAAVGLNRESVYLASLAVARPLTGRIPPEEDARLVALARHHLSLLRPRKLLLLGQAASRVLSEPDVWPPVNRIRDVNLFGAKTGAVVSYHPQFLMDKPACKNEAWKHLLLLSRGPSE